VLIKLSNKIIFYKKYSYHP